MEALCERRTTECQRRLSLFSVLEGPAQDLPQCKGCDIFQETSKLLKAGIAQRPRPSEMVRVCEEHDLAVAAVEEQPGYHLEPPPSGSWFGRFVD